MEADLLHLNLRHLLLILILRHDLDRRFDMKPLTITVWEEVDRMLLEPVIETDPLLGRTIEIEGILKN